MSIAEKRISLVDAQDIAKKYSCYFAICNNCLWCASVFSTSLSGHIAEKHRCPSCRRSVEIIPLADDEIYRMEYSRIGGLRLEFTLQCGDP